MRQQGQQGRRASERIEKASGPVSNTDRVPPALSESWPDMSMNKDTAEALTALATLATLPGLTPSQLFLVAVVLYLSKHDKGTGK